MDEKPNPLIFLLVCCFASASWLGANSIWVQLSVFVQHLPEGWKLGSVLDIVIQAASIGPIIFVLIDRLSKIQVSHAITIQVSLIICILVNLPLAFYWKETAWIFGSSHSIVILTVAFIVGMINIGSDVIWLPYMKDLKNVYLPAYFIGSGLSAVFPSLVSIAQGASSYECVFDEKSNQTFPQYIKPRFSSLTFYMIMFVWALLACVSFYLLHWHKKRLEPFNWRANPNPTITQQPINVIKIKVEPNRRRDCLILLGLAILGIEINTILPSLLSYVTLPYSQGAYFWALILSALAQPVGSFSAYIFKPRRTLHLAILSAICLTCSITFVVIATQSPHPIFKELVIGSVFSVCLASSIQLIGCFLRTVLLESYRDDQPNSKDRLFWAGLCLQAGSFFGTLIVYPMVNVLKLFQDADPC